LNQKLSIESKRFLDELNDTVQLVLEQIRHTHYTIVSFPQKTDGYQLMLRDDFTGRSVHLVNNETNEYSFTIDPQIEASKKPNRFKIITFKSQTDVNHINQNLVKSYPNPSTSEVVLESPLNMETIKVYSLEGQLIEQRFPQNCKTTRLNDLQKGVYLIEILLENGQTTRIKQIVL
jgi:hypothetical protein